MFLPFIKTKYYDVPTCPRCGSNETGRFIFVLNNTSNIEKIIASHLKKGEIIKPVFGFHETDFPDVFCNSCGCEWYTDIPIRYITKEEIKIERTRRNITKEKYENVKNFKENYLKKQRAEKALKRKKQKNSTKSTNTTKTDKQN